MKSLVGILKGKTGRIQDSARQEKKESWSTLSDWTVFLRTLFLLVLILPLCLVTNVWAQDQEVADTSSAMNRLDLGLQLYKQGALEEAVSHLQKAADAFATEHQPIHQVDSLMALAHVYRALGYHSKAAQSLDLALILAQGAGDRKRQAAVMGTLGQVYLEVGRLDAASDFLDQGLALAREEGDAARMAVILNERGRLYVRQQKDEKALSDFNESQTHAEATGLHQLTATASLNAAQTFLRLGRFGEAQYGLDQALSEIQTLPDSHDKAYTLISLGLMLQTVGSPDHANHPELIIKAAKVLEKAGEVSKSIADQRAMSYAFGHRGHLYERHGRFEDALLLTRLAVTAAQQVQAPESLYRWQWQTGRIMKAIGKPEEAIAAYQRASETVQSLRPEMAITAGGATTSFQESGGQLFFELADLLLQRAASTPDQQSAQPYLVKARQSIELFKSAELRDYFRDDCVDALQERMTKLDDLPKIAPTAVIMYPILLPDRTELLISVPQGIRRVGIPVGKEQITQEVRIFRRLLEKRTTREYLPHAQQLYDWLIRPLEAELADLSIDTLVIVPDGALRTIPLSALHDGQQFLVEKYAVATTPGLDLTDPHPLQRDRVKVLSAGLTEGVQGFSPLPNVLMELQALENLYGSQPLLNRTFLTASLEKEMRDEEFTIVHIASHAKFESQVGDSFLLTFDDKLTMDQLNEAIGYFRFRDEPLELLTLSACETAAGDDRAALGLAGLAIKAGARSALATLWYINDEASSVLVAEFYRQLKDPVLSKAQALQQAQFSLLNNPLYQHPSYWAPFLLLNNWL